MNIGLRLNARTAAPAVSRFLSGDIAIGRYEFGDVLGTEPARHQMRQVVEVPIGMAVVELRWWVELICIQEGCQTALVRPHPHPCRKFLVKPMTT